MRSIWEFRVIGLLAGAIVVAAISIVPVNAAEKLTLLVTDDYEGGYARALFKHWIDEDKDGCNTRYEVLIAEAIVKPQVGKGCYLTGGKWRSPYDRKIFYSPNGLDIDHLVPLAEAWRSGAWAWDSAKRMAYANDLDDKQTLVAVTASLNRSKGDRDPAHWMPPKRKCRYLSNWIAVKWRFDLTVDWIEADYLRTEIGACNITNVVIKEAVSS